MNKLVKSVKKLTKKMTLTHLLVALLVVALVVAVVHSQRNQENFSWWSRWIAETVRVAQQAAAKKVALTKQYSRTNWERIYMPTQPDWAPAKLNLITPWINSHRAYLRFNGEPPPLDGGTWQTKCAYIGKIDESIRPVDLTIETNNLKTIGGDSLANGVYKYLDFNKCQAICDFHSAPETSKGQWKGGCIGFNITFDRHARNKDEKVKCVFYSNPNSYNPPTSSIPGLGGKLSKRMQNNWDKNAKGKPPNPKWWGLRERRAKWTYWPRKSKEAGECH